MSSMFNDIHEFHEKFKLPPVGTPGALPSDMLEFRIKFMQEELDEYKEAMEKGNQELALDALVDLVYVAMGTAYLSRYPFLTAWRRVQEANMRKQRTLRVEDSKRGSTYDVTKPPGWKPPVHTDLVENSVSQMQRFIGDLGVDD